MANLNERLFISLPLDQYFVDKDTGQPLANGTIEFYRDSSRITPKTVYQLSGTEPDYTYTPLPNPITLSAVGNIQNNAGVNKTLYFFPYTGTPDSPGDEIDLYYIVCKSEGGIEQWTREGWPNIHSGNDPTQDPFPAQNQLSNSQFSRVLINEGFTTTYTVSGATNQRFEFAPDWFFLISGSGTVQVSRTAVAGSSNVTSNPPYYITVTVSAGVTACKLVQRMHVNSGLWASNDNEDIYLAGNFVAQATGDSAAVEMYYIESSGGVAEEIISANVGVDDFATYSGTSDQIPLSSNTDTGNNGYIDIYLSFAAASTVRVTSLQIVPTLDSAGGNELQYDPNSSNREQAYMGDYYIPRLANTHLDSYMIGWDFPLNPAQWGESGTFTNTAKYIWDQTIAAKQTTGNISYARNTATGGLALTTPDTDNAFYLLQYLSGKQVKRMIGSKLSSNLWAYKTAGAGAVTARVYLYRATTTDASIPTLATTIGTVASDGVFTLSAANWTEIARSGLGTATATLNLLSASTDIYNSNNDHKFTGWEITDAGQISDTNLFAMVVTFAYTSSSTTIVVNSASLVPGDIPTRPATETLNQVLQDCQYYYQQSFPVGTTPANNAGTTGAPNWPQSKIAGATGAIGATINFRPYMRIAPTITLYNPSDTNSQIRNTSRSNNCSASIASNVHYSGFVPQCTTSAGSAVGDSLMVHYKAEARLGVV